MKEFPILYAKASTGKIKMWHIIAKGDTIITIHGYEDGKLQESREQVKGVNIGRSNETTPEQQAELEAASKWQKKVDQQYTPNRDDIKDYSDQEVLLPMLAKKYTEQKHKVKFPCYVQPKLNGVRCIYQNGKFMSRTGKEYTTLSHLVPELKKLGLALPDGEIYIHGLSLQTIVSYVKADKGEDTKKLEYWIYDKINQDPFIARADQIFSAFVLGDFVKVKRVFTYKAESEADIKKYHDEFVQQGFEGVIIRNMDGMYQIKHRSSDLLKYKEFVDEEFEIVGGREGTGLSVGQVIFDVKTKKGQVFGVRPKGTNEQRKEWLRDIEKLKGKMLTVRYQNLSDSGVPIFPVGVAIRDYE